MESLLKFEFRKLFQARALYVCAGVLVLLIIVFAGTNKLTDMAVEEFAGELEYNDETMVGDEDFEDDFESSITSSMGLLSNNSGSTWLLSGLSNIYMIVVFAAFIPVFVCGDFGNGTIKNILTKGYSRSEVYWAKYIVCLAVSVGYALITFIVGFLVGTFMWRIGDNWSAKFIALLLAQLVAVAAYNALFCFLAALFKRVGPALAFSIAITVALPLILVFLELVINDSRFMISEYWLSGAIGLVSSPLAEGKDILTSVIVSVIYGIIFTILGWVIARRREV